MEKSFIVKREKQIGIQIMIKLIECDTISTINSRYFCLFAYQKVFDFVVFRC